MKHPDSLEPGLSAWGGASFLGKGVKEQKSSFVGLAGSETETSGSSLVPLCGKVSQVDDTSCLEQVAPLELSSV